MSFHSVLSKFPFSSWSFPPLKNHYYYYLTTSKDARSFATVRIELMMEKAFKAHRDLLLLPWHRHSYCYRRRRHQPSLSILFLCLPLPSSSSMILHQLSWLHRWNQWSRYRRRWYQIWPITSKKRGGNMILVILIRQVGISKVAHQPLMSHKMKQNKYNREDNGIINCSLTCHNSKPTCVHFSQRWWSSLSSLYSGLGIIGCSHSPLVRIVEKIVKRKIIVGNTQGERLKLVHDKKWGRVEEVTSHRDKKGQWISSNTTNYMINSDDTYL